MKTNNLTLSANEKIGLVSNLSTMLKAGIPILEAVDSLLEDAKGGTKKILTSLNEDLMQGKRVHETFSEFPQVFDRVTINVIRAAEEAGSLETALFDLKTSIRKEMEFTDKIKSAMVYPILIMVVFVGVLLMMLVVVVPKIASVFGRLKVDLPIPTKMMIFASNMLLNNTWQVIVVLAIVVVLIAFLYKSQKSFFLNILFSLPLVNQLVKEIDLTRFTRNIYILLTAGLSITTALELAQDVVLRKDVLNLIKSSHDMMLSGKKLSEGLRQKKGVFPTIMIKLIEVGEKTGSLDKSMLDISEYLDYEVTNTLKNLTVVLEPIMLVVVGGLVGGMMMAIIAPIYGLIGQVSGAR